MKIHVFIGPTLSPAEASGELDAVYRPPVAQGDVYRAAQDGAWAIGIVDGYFDRVPAVWHKEILWAMAQGIHVYGSASMGALRAAELAPFGMVGVGWIFEAYRDGGLEADDEVAVAHGPAESGYLAQSEALVNIRRTLASATSAGVIAPVTGSALEHLARELFYPERAYPILLQRGAERGLPSLELDDLRAWLPRGRVDQKRLDVLAMLRAMRDHRAVDPGPKQARFSFEHTTYWDRVTRSAGRVAAVSGGHGQELALDILLDEVRLAGERYPRAFEGALLRELALGLAARLGWAATQEVLERTAEEFRRARGLLSPADLAGWLERNELSREHFAALMHAETLLRWAREELQGDALRRLPDVLRVGGEYGPLVARARDKQRVLECYGLENPGLADLGLTRDALLGWYFARLGRSAPASTWQYARAVGFADEAAFLRAVAREYCYVRQRESGANEAGGAPQGGGPR